MKVKKGKQVKKYSVGGAIAAQVGLGALQGLIGGAQYLGGTAQAQKLKAPSTATPSSFRELYQSAQNQKLVQQNLDEINRASATYLQALQAGGPQSVAAGISGISRQQATQTQDVLNAQMLREMKAAEALALADERALGRERDVYETRFGESQAARAAGLQNVFGAAGSTAKGLLALEKSDSKFEVPTAEATSVKPRSLSSVLPESPSAGEVRLSGEPVALPDLGIKKPGPGNIMRTLPPFKITELEEELLGKTKTSFLKDGGMVTGGKFSHKTNPIDIIQKGEKIGEMTGGEVILNPSQQKKLSKESAYFRQLLKKFNKQK
jgi:hypothetical protein